MNTFTVEVTQADFSLAHRIVLEFRPGGWSAKEGEIAHAIARHRIACAPDDLTAASQLEHSGLISREKYNHIVENIRARESIRGAMA